MKLKKSSFIFIHLKFIYNIPQRFLFQLFVQNSDHKQFLLFEYS